MVATRNAVKASPVVSANKSRGAVHDDSGISLAHIDAPTLSKFTPVVATEVPKMKIVDKQLIPAGIPVSGRIWKAPGVKYVHLVILYLNFYYQISYHTKFLLLFL